MIILAIDTSTKCGSVALLRGGELVGVRAISSGAPYSATLLGEVSALLEECGLPLESVELFAVGAGPGSFTGLRVGLTTVKAWAELYQRPVAGISGLEAIAWTAHATAQKRGSLLAPLLDAGRGELFAGLYRPSGPAPETVEAVGDDLVGPPGGVVEQVLERCAGETPVFASPTPEAAEAALRHSRAAGALVEVVSGVLAPAIGRLAWARARRGELADALRLDAHYVRRPDAELKWKGGP